VRGVRLAGQALVGRSLRTLKNQISDIIILIKSRNSIETDSNTFTVIESKRKEKFNRNS
jgi:hypothetical protein